MDRKRTVIYKSLLAILIITAMLTGLCGCSSKGGKLTLMIYMIGSDLESKSGLGTEDLEEIAGSGVDLGDVNVIVCAGGTEKWRNEDMSADNNTILRLKRGGFAVEETRDAASMGDKETLSGFLTYCTENYPADEYALILWDHGSGPVMGFGMDTLHDRDGLTLQEMREAMEASPFGPDNKLAWVGFDACLMASAELACVWSDYADYLVASQEVEPAFGWRYSFLKDAAKVDTPELLNSVTRTYLESCEAYYVEKGYAERDTTLSCMDLSKAGALKNAVNDLFGKAAADVGKSYNRLAGRRIKTRALGRATTGSEYDLVDLNDAAEQLAAYYPEEAAAVQTALGNMIISNATNTDSLSGVSLYYPFFNKYYYENSWEAAYDELDVFPGYSEYLDAYVDTWLGEDLLSSASDAAPMLAEEGKYTLQLTSEQAETFAEARLHILLHETGDAYYPVFTSPEVRYDERKQMLTADFDGKALYAVNDRGKYTLPISSLISNDDGIPHYAVNCTLYKFSGYDVFDMTPEEQEQNEEEFTSQTRAWFNLEVNPEDDSVRTSALLARDDEEVGLDNLQTGKAEELGKGDWNYYFFDLDSAHILTRNKDGVILPFNSWNTMAAFSFSEFPIEDGLEFEYAPLEEGGDYALMFEITDTKGNKYCSEPAQIDSSGMSFREDEPKQTTAVKWTEGDKITLLDRDGLILRLANIEHDGEMIQTFELTNNTDEEVKMEGGTENIVVNGTIDAGPLLFSIRAKPGETSTTTSTLYDEEPYQDRLEFGDAESYGIISKVSSVEFSVNASSMETHKSIWSDEPFRVEYSDETAPPLRTAYGVEGGLEQLKADYSHPYMGALAEEQRLYKDEAIESTLLFYGANDRNYEEGVIRTVNNSDQVQYFAIRGIAINGIYVDASLGIKIMPHTVSYTHFPSLRYDPEEYGITGINDITMVVSRTTNRHQFQLGLGECKWYQVKLKEHADAKDEFKVGDKTLYEKDGLKVALVECLLPDPDEGRSFTQWKLSVENDTDEALTIQITELSENGEYNGNNMELGHWHTMMGYSHLGAHQKRYVTIDTNKEIKTIKFKLMTMSFTGDKILDTSDEFITLRAE